MKREGKRKEKERKKKREEERKRNRAGRWGYKEIQEGTEKEIK